MKLSEVREIAYEFIALYGLEGWRFKFNTRMTATLGICKYRTKSIELQVEFCRTGTQDQIIDTIKHEISHALVGRGHRHDDVWKAKAIEIGATPKACADVPRTEKGAKYTAACTCGVPHFKYRKPKRLTGWYCVRAGRKAGELTWKPTSS